MASDQIEPPSKESDKAGPENKTASARGSSSPAEENRDRAPSVTVRTSGTESNADTSESRVARAPTNHVSSTDRHACIAASAACSESKEKDRQVEHTSQPRMACAQQEQKEIESKGQAKDEKTMCIAEPQESDANKKKRAAKKMYEIPLTILPSEDAAAAAPRKKQSKVKEIKEGQTTGRWTHAEHQAFLEGLKVFGREWKKVAEKIPTRTSAQIRSHAQKYFSKVAREEAIAAMNEQPSPALQQNEQQLSASVQRTAERILANPAGAQAEVEDTLRQLRERYRQLQVRLEESQRARGLPPMDRIAEDEAPGPDGLVHQQRGGHDDAPGLDRRKRSLEEANLQQHDDGVSSVSSDLSHSLASLSPKREFGSEELIALHVLGGTLPRSASGTDLEEHARSSSFSEAEESEEKRQRLDDDSKDHAAGGGGQGGDSDRDQDGDEAMI